MTPVRRASRPAAALLAAALAAGCGGGSTAPATPLPATPMASAAAADGGAPATGLRFEDATAAAGVVFRHLASYTPAKHMPEIMGGGVVVADFNRDGAPDIVATNSGAIEADARPPDAANALFLNDGRGRFTDASRAWGLPSTGYGMGGTAGDLDGDGWTDLVLTGYGAATVLLRNTGAAFEPLPDNGGIPLDDGWTTSAGLFDADRDGDLDLFLARYVHYDPASAAPCAANDVQVYCTPHLFDSQPDQLWRNDGTGRFTDVTAEAGIVDGRGKSISLSIADIEGDGDGDVYVANDITPNQLWRNDGAGRFDDIAARAGVALGRDGRAEAGMGSDLSDIDGDGRLDIVVANFSGEPSSLYRQSDDLIFDEVSDRSGVGPASRLRLKWGTAFFDPDNDGDEDFMVVAGHIYDNAPEVDRSLTFGQTNLLFEHLGDDTFREVAAGAGPALGDAQVSRGLAMADLDSDGGVDFVVGNNGGTLQVGRNVTPNRGAWVGLWVEGRGGNRTAIGARITATVGGRTLLREVKGADSYASLSDRRIVLGLGQATSAEVTVRWPDGETAALGSLAAGTWYRVAQGAAPAPFMPGAAVIAP